MPGLPAPHAVGFPIQEGAPRPLEARTDRDRRILAVVATLLLVAVSVADGRVGWPVVSDTRTNLQIGLAVGKGGRGRPIGDDEGKVSPSRAPCGVAGAMGLRPTL
jgi:hypothetical protein